MKKRIKDPLDKSKTLFDHLNEVCYGQRVDYFQNITDGDKKTWSSYMINRFLSMEESYIETINYLQKYSNILSPENYYKLLISLIPKRKLYNKYIKESKDENKVEKWVLDLFVKYYEISLREAGEYIELLRKSKEGIESIYNICKLYGADPKLIKKLKL